MATVIEATSGVFVENATRLEQEGVSTQLHGLLSGYLSGWSKLQIAVTVLLLLVTYDQCMLRAAFSTTSRLTDQQFGMSTRKAR